MSVMPEPGAGVGVGTLEPAPEPEPEEASSAKAVVAVRRAQVAPTERARKVLRTLESILLQ